MKMTPSSRLSFTGAFFVLLAKGLNKTIALCILSF
jgi:hypothetical protein